MMGYAEAFKQVQERFNLKPPDENFVNNSKKNISTGLLSLDQALFGGFPQGSLVEIFSGNAVGKTIFAYFLLSEAHKQGYSVGLLDLEKKFNTEHVDKNHVRIDDLLVVQVDNNQQVYNIIPFFKKLDLLIVDSLAACDNDVLDIYKSLLSLDNTTIIILNQMRNKLGVGEVSFGGDMTRRFSDIRIELKKNQLIKWKQSELGRKIVVKVKKNRFAIPQDAEFDVYVGEGISVETDLLREAEKKSTITKKGHFYYYNSICLGQGWNRSRLTLKNNPQLFQEIKNAVITNSK